MYLQIGKHLKMKSAGAIATTQSGFSSPYTPPRKKHSETGAFFVQTVQRDDFTRPLGEMDLSGKKILKKSENAYGKCIGS